MNAPTTPRGGFNDADLRYIRSALRDLRDAQKASDQAATWSSDSVVRTLARRTRTRQADAIGEMTSILDAWGRSEDGPLMTPSLPPIAGGDLSTLGRVELDRWLIESLTAQAAAAIARARTEMIEGFEPSIRRMAEEAIHANNRALSTLRPGAGTRSRPGAPTSTAGCLKHRH